MSNRQRTRAATLVGALTYACLAAFASGCSGLLPLGTAGAQQPPPTSQQASSAPSSQPTPAGSTTAPGGDTSTGTADYQLDRSGAAATSDNRSGEVDYAATSQYAIDILQNADRVWTAWFKAQGYPEPYVVLDLIQPGQSLVLTPCTSANGMPSSYPNAFYCDVSNGTDNGHIIIPIETLARMWSGDIFGTQVSDVKAVGDYAAGVILSHEFGHSVTAELAEDTGRTPMAKGKNKELIADCFAGVHTYALSLGTDGSLDPGDVDEALNALAAIGDQGDGGTDPHGTPAERKNAFQIGLYGSQADPRGGVPANCTKAFWPEFGG
ncbi:hypothetical protein GCM10009841_14420 [Microlunatus panaciterrae]|uniref:Metalloprotease n=1 Tax=Microlunatus panaciterrae TaxID=400768 RepID=A0ABS2RND3_9ACTN|nr:neutral zinc metallopeptidase [Microlunatus panaciterrae]MBM7800002.1 putative metalloprotease [Microlunatus panaciterrae]